VRARKIGFVFQSFHMLPHRSTTDNVALGQLYTGTGSRERLQLARLALDRVGLAKRLDAMPTTLSGGERQRVAIARALINHPSLLLCDEPTGNLDSGTAAQVMDLIDDLHRDGVTVFVITHDPITAARAGRHLTVRDGVVVADATTRRDEALEQVGQRGDRA
jgi:putative ABC transport system ATP-binding protein